MKKLLSTLAIVATLFGIEAFGGHDGNGGFGIQCPQPVKANNGTVLPPGLYTLDYWDAIHNLGYQWGLGPANMDWRSKVKLAATRLSKYNIRVAKYLNDIATDPSKYINFKDETVYCGNAEAVGEDVHQTLDIGSSIIPGNCKLTPIGRNITGCSSGIFKLKAKIFIKPNLFAKLNEDSKAAIVLHEAIYLDIPKSSYGERSSEGTRMLVALLGRADFDQLEPDQVRVLLLRTGTYGYDFIYEGLDVNIREERSLSFKKREDDNSIREIRGINYANATSLKVFDKTMTVWPKQIYQYQWDITRNNKFMFYDLPQEGLETLKLADGVFAKVKLLYGSDFKLAENGLYIERFDRLEILEIQTLHSPVQFEKSEYTTVTFPWGKEWGCLDVPYKSEVKYKGKTYKDARLICFGDNGKVRISAQATQTTIKGSLFERNSGFEPLFMVDEKKSAYEFDDVGNLKKLLNLLKIKPHPFTSSHNLNFNRRVQVIVDDNDKVHCVAHPIVYRTVGKRDSDGDYKYYLQDQPATIKLKDGSKKTFEVPFVIRFNEKEEAISAEEGRTCL